MAVNPETSAKSTVAKRRSLSRAKGVRRCISDHPAALGAARRSRPVGHWSEARKTRPRAPPRIESADAMASANDTRFSSRPRTSRSRRRRRGASQDTPFPSRMAGGGHSHGRRARSRRHERLCGRQSLRRAMVRRGRRTPRHRLAAEMAETLGGERRPSTREEPAAVETIIHRPQPTAGGTRSPPRSPTCSPRGRQPPVSRRRRPRRSRARRESRSGDRRTPTRSRAPEVAPRRAPWRATAVAIAIDIPSGGRA